MQDPKGPHVDRETSTVQFPPIVVDSYEGLESEIAKLVGVSDDHDAVAAAAKDAHDRFGDHVSASCSQPYYVDVTHPDGDMPNDVLMFAHSGLSIAMGNATPEVQRAARRVTTSNEEEGFADAVERFILPQA